MPEVRRDELFRSAVTPGSFRFDAEVASSFDDMARRSIPLYRDTHAAFSVLIRNAPEGAVHDLGCSTGSLLLRLDLDGTGRRLVGHDPSRAMLDIAADRLPRAEWRNNDAENAVIDGAAVVVLGWTLQFTPPERRLELLCRIRAALPAGGLLLIAEKTEPEPAFAEFAMAAHDAFRLDNGYTPEQLVHKRAALDGVLRPWPAAQTEEAMRQAGFRHSQEILRWHAFVSWVCLA
ncbi:MAG: carboxy-S-adenosyl-L-methionine synthase [Verrucomicrobiota bacterium]|jgi:tRNA (cmo5U34)-methyltransferase